MTDLGVDGKIIFKLVSKCLNMWMHGAGSVSSSLEIFSRICDTRKVIVSYLLGLSFSHIALSANSFISTYLLLKSLFCMVFVIVY
jgi:hypothetical protein